MSKMASQITSLMVVYSTVYPGVDQRKHQGSASLAFVTGIHRWPVNLPHKGLITRKKFPFDDVIMAIPNLNTIWHFKKNHLSINGPSTAPNTSACIFMINMKNGYWILNNISSVMYTAMSDKCDTYIMKINLVRFRYAWLKRTDFLSILLITIEEYISLFAIIVSNNKQGEIVMNNLETHTNTVRCRYKAVSFL